MILNRKSLILGGNGALGRAMVNSFKLHGWGVVSLDHVANVQADANVLVDKSRRLKE